MKTKKVVTINRLQPKKTSGQGDAIAEFPQKQGTVGYKQPPIASQFKPGQSPNPSGKPVGTRNRLQGDFIRALSEDFTEYGRVAIFACRTESPAVYIRVIASLLPSEIEVKRPLEGLSDDELIACVDLLRKQLGAARSLH